jgi:CRISPR-associated protein Cmr1
MKTRDPKKQFPNTNVPEVALKPDYRVTEIRRYKLITPLFGGGVEEHKADPITVIRGASVRGQLRFWWRATRGGQFNGSLEAMRKGEQAIWGSAAKKGDENSGPSEVQVVIEKWTDGKGDSPFEVKQDRKPRPRQGSDAHPYVAFPLQPEQEEAKAGMKTLEVKVGVTFTLSISYPKDVQDDVQSALWAWETFGGIGGRTRRGFGALHLEEHWINGEKKPVTLLPAIQVSTELRNQLKKFEGKWPDGVPHLEHSLHFEVYPKVPSSPLEVWKSLINRYQSFRQFDARVDRQTGKPKNQGLSLWPEANVLRSRSKKTPKWPAGIKPKLVEKFPRAAFGLPILFHLPHDDKKTYPLQGDKLDPKSDKSYERLASRLILKPLACANGQYVGLAVALVGPAEPPTGLQIKESLPIQKPVKWELEPSEASSEPLNQILHGETDVIEAFLKTLR